MSEINGGIQANKTGLWDFVHYDPDYLIWAGTCTVCGKKHESTENVGKLRFCPHCGSEMLGEKKPVLIAADESGE